MAPSLHQRSSSRLFVIAISIVIVHFCMYSGNCQVVNEALSSPAKTKVMKGSTVWLHWNYTVPSFLTFEWQTAGYINDPSKNTTEILARKDGPSGLFKALSVIPAPFTGRVNTISPNNTLVIKNLQYNDTSYKFSSFVKSSLPGIPSFAAVQMKPLIEITVQGPPAFIVSPPSAIEVAENGVLSLSFKVDGNPQPSAESTWTHLTVPATYSTTKVYPFVYSGTYVSSSPGASYCGRILKTQANNSVGRSSFKETNVTVILDLSSPAYLQAGKPSLSCVQVTWTKKESGACFVKYVIKFKNGTGDVIYTEIGYNVGEMEKCSIPSSTNITDVELTMSFKSSTSTFYKKVLETAIPTTKAPTTTAKPAGTTASKPPTAGANTGAIVGGAIGGLVVLILIILIVCCIIKNNKRKSNDPDSGEPDYPLADKRDNVYASAEERRSHDEPTYADPNKPALIYGKLGEGGGRKGPRPSKKEADDSDYADVKVDEHGYPAVGAVTNSYTDGYRSKVEPSNAGRGDSGRRVAPEKHRAPPPYNDPKLDDDGYPASRSIPPVYAQVDKHRKYR